MNEPSVQFKTDDRVAHVTLNRPDKHNAFNDDVIDRLHDIVDQLVDDEQLIAAVLRGNGESFSAGADLNWMEEASRKSEQENREDAVRLAELLHNLYTLPMTTIASVRGTAMGGGIGLVSCCDVVLARRSTTFSFSEVRVGLIPATISPYVLAAIGSRQARRYFQTGETFTGERAREIGLVHELVGSEREMNSELDELLQNLRKNAPQAMRNAKTLCRDMGHRSISRDVIEETARRIAEARCSEEGREGIRAFLEDRAPDWIDISNESDPS